MGVQSWKLADGQKDTLQQKLARRLELVREIHRLQHELRGLTNQRLCAEFEIADSTLRMYRTKFGYPRQRAARRGATGCGAIETPALQLVARP